MTGRVSDGGVEIASTGEWVNENELTGCAAPLLVEASGVHSPCGRISVPVLTILRLGECELLDPSDLRNASAPCLRQCKGNGRSDAPSGE
mmetsp:Transcript_4174/g.11787  ORF Transcript_4174/g.11787 Transcript_4174/m.11787 type:complete len:90 (-) Transcript_4174:960-1229(-)